MYDNGKDDELREKDERTPREKLEDEREEKKLKKWAWSSFVYSLCRGDISRKEQILKMSFISIMNWKSFEAENVNLKQQYENGN